MQPKSLINEIMETEEHCPPIAPQNDAASDHHIVYYYSIVSPWSVDGEEKIAQLQHGYSIHCSCFSLLCFLLSSFSPLRSFTVRSRADRFVCAEVYLLVARTIQYWTKERREPDELGIPSTKAKEKDNAKRGIIEQMKRNGSENQWGNNGRVRALKGRRWVEHKIWCAKEHKRPTW